MNKTTVFLGIVIALLLAFIAFGDNLPKPRLEWSAAPAVEEPAEEPAEKPADEPAPEEPADEKAEDPAPEEPDDEDGNIVKLTKDEYDALVAAEDELANKEPAEVAPEDPADEPAEDPSDKEPAEEPTKEEAAAPADYSDAFTRTLSLELEQFSGPINLSGWAPKDLSANGDWYDEHTAQDSWEVVKQTWKAESDTFMPGAKNVFASAGVLVIGEWAESQKNESGIWEGSLYHDSPDSDQSIFSMLCPEGSFCSSYALNFGKVEIGPAGNPFVVLEIPTCGDNCGQGLLIQNWLERPDLDLNTTVIVSDYGEPAAASYDEFAVPASAAEHASEMYWTQQAEAAHSHRNNGSGPEDNDLFIQHVFSLVDMSYTILGHTAEDGWFLIWTNVLAYGEH